MGPSPVPYFGHGWPRNCREQLARLPSGNLARFLISLYFTVLVDQAMHAHFREQYPRFESLTRYPKFCHGLSQFQHNPRGILLGPVEQGVITSQECSICCRPEWSCSSLTSPSSSTSTCPR